MHQVVTTIEAIKKIFSSLDSSKEQKGRTLVNITARWS